MRKINMLIIIALVSSFLLPFAVAQEKFNLEYKFQEGQTRYMLFITQGQVNIELPQSVQEGAMPMSFPLIMAMSLSMKTLKVYSDGAADVEIRLVDGKMYMMGQEISMLQQQGATQPIRIRMGKKGNLIKLLTPINIPQGNPFMGTINPDMLVQNFSRLTVLPQEEVGVGDKWEQKIDTEIPNLGKLNLLQKMTFTSVEKIGDVNCAKISIEIPPSTFQFNIPMGPPTQGQEPPTLPLNGKLEMKGDMVFDPQNGYMVSQSGTLKMLINVTMPAGGQVGAPSSLSTNIDMKFKVTTMDKKPTLPTPTQIQQQFQPQQESQA
ncbi:hypothetical protein H5T87_03330 [bacterium]|nr:hypothetical protein [bacterium]